jgi:hypothetical protein
MAQWELEGCAQLPKKKERQPILDRYGGVVLAKPREVGVPSPYGPPFDALRKPARAFSCADCGHFSSSRKAILGHCNKEHEWYVTKADRTHWSEVMVQTFFEGSNLRYFIAQMETEDDGSYCTPASPINVSGGYEELKQKFLSGMKEGREKDAEHKKILDAAMEKTDNTGWWTHTRWQLHFGDRHVGNIAHASRLPDRKERELVDAKTIVISMIKHAVDGLSFLHDDTPNWLRTANATNRVENRPMVRLHNVESLDTYINYWVRFKGYCLAQRKMEARDERRRASGGDGEEDENDMSGGDASGEDDEEGDGEEADGSEGVDKEGDDEGGDEEGASSDTW